MYLHYTRPIRGFIMPISWLAIHTIHRQIYFIFMCSFSLCWVSLDFLVMTRTLSVWMCMCACPTPTFRSVFFITLELKWQQKICLASTLPLITAEMLVLSNGFPNKAQWRMPGSVCIIHKFDIVTNLGYCNKSKNRLKCMLGLFGRSSHFYSVRARMLEGKCA